jgi:hypothetical protein
MLWYDLNARRLQAAEHAERLAADARRANPARKHRRWVRRRLPLAAGLELAERARRWARPQAEL